MGSSSDQIFGITTSILTVPPGATNAVLITPGPYVTATLIKYASGGSVSIFGNPFQVSGVSSVITGTSLVTGFSGSYLLGASEALSIDGPAQFYVAATGTTALISVLQGLTQGIPSFTNYG